jgi:hypothetical protein
MNSERQKEYYLGVFYKDIFIAFVSQHKYYIDFEKAKGNRVYRWTNRLDYAQIYWYYERDVNDDNQFNIRQLKEFYNKSMDGYAELLSQDYDRNNGRLVAFLRPNFHNICQDQLHFKYLSKHGVRLLKLKDF